MATQTKTKKAKKPAPLARITDLLQVVAGRDFLSQRAVDPPGPGALRWRTITNGAWLFWGGSLCTTARDVQHDTTSLPLQPLVEAARRKARAITDEWALFEGELRSEPGSWSLSGTLPADGRTLYELDMQHAELDLAERRVRPLLQCNAHHSWGREHLRVRDAAPNKVELDLQEALFPGGTEGPWVALTAYLALAAVGARLFAQADVAGITVESPPRVLARVAVDVQLSALLVTAPSGDGCGLLMPMRE